VRSQVGEYAGTGERIQCDAGETGARTRTELGKFCAGRGTRANAGLCGRAIYAGDRRDCSRQRSRRRWCPWWTSRSRSAARAIAAAAARDADARHADRLSHRAVA